MASFLNDENAKNENVGGVTNSVNILKNIESYTLNGWTIRYVSYSSIKLFFLKAGEIWQYLKIGSISVWKECNLQKAKGNVPLSIHMFHVNSLWASDTCIGDDPLEVPSKEYQGVHSSTICKMKKQRKQLKCQSIWSD